MGAAWQATRPLGEIQGETFVFPFQKTRDPYSSYLDKKKKFKKGILTQEFLGILLGSKMKQYQASTAIPTVPC